MKLADPEINWMKLLNMQLKTFGIWISQHWASTLVMLYPLLIIIDFYTLPLPEHIYQGQPFFYAWYMDNFRRVQILILIGILLFFVLLVSSIFMTKTGRFRFTPPIVFFISALLFVLWGASTPAFVTGSEIATTPVYNQTKYILYARPLFNPPSGYEFVLVKCDSLGLLCQFAEKWERESTRFDASNYRLHLNSFDHTLYVYFEGGSFTKYPLE
jgi:hypothetical protein